jgi:23S rRNA pseudouridine1911/1915/1917 synthase
MTPTWTASAPERLDGFLAKESQELSRVQAKAAIEAGEVSVNGATVTKPSLRLNAGDRVEWDGEVVREDAGVIKPADLKLKILYEDDACFVIDKPAGIAVHPGSGMEKDEKTILHGIAHVFKKQKLPFSSDSVLVHRLDQETTGCLLIAKTREAHRTLQKQFETRTVKKFYLTLVAGVPHPPKAVIDAPIGRSTSDRTKMAITRMSAARQAKTSYQVLSQNANASLVVCELHTGRTHQLRVHLLAIGHGILGDVKYANQKSEDVSMEYGINHLCLHAWKLTFVSPADGKEHTVEAPVTKEMKSALKKLELSMKGARS